MTAFLFLLPLLVLSTGSRLAGQAPPATASEPKELLENPTLADGARGWLLRDAEARPNGGREGLPSVLLAGVEDEKAWSHVGLAFEDLPRERVLAFRCALQGTRDGQRATINAFALTEDESLCSQWSETLSVKKDAWIEAQTTYVLDVDAVRFTLWVINSEESELAVCDAHLALGEAASAELRDLRGPGVIRASARTAVRPCEAGDSGLVTFPIPGTYREQVPLTFDLSVDPPEALKGFSWKPREDGLNWLCEIEVAPPESGAEVRWESLVLVGGREVAELPPAEAPEAPEGTKRWLKSTACVQSEDPLVRAKAETLAAGTSGIGAYVEAVIAFTSTNQGEAGVVFDALDAAKALRCGGSCTSRANLAAALLRARGIPARTLAHLPTWSGPLYEHWLVEYWHPATGWVWIEPSRGAMQPPPYTLVVLNVANPGDEDLSFEPSMSHSGVMLGAPELAVHKHSDELLVARGSGFEAARSAGNLATGVMRLRDAPDEAVRSLFAAALSSHAALCEQAVSGRLDPARTSRVEAAIESGDPAELLRALEPERR